MGDNNNEDQPRDRLGQYASKNKGLDAPTTGTGEGSLSIYVDDPLEETRHDVSELNVAHAEYLPNGQLDVENSTYKDANSALLVALSNVQDIDGVVEMKQTEEGDYIAKVVEDEEDPYSVRYTGHMYITDDGEVDGDPAAWCYPDSKYQNWYSRRWDNAHIETKFRELQPVQDFLSGKNKELLIEVGQLAHLVEDEFQQRLDLDYADEILIADDYVYNID